MKSQLKKFQKGPLLLSIIFFLFSCAVFFFLHRLTKENDIVAKQAQSAWEEAADKRLELQSLERSLKETVVERTQLDTHFIKNPDVVPFLDILEKTADKVGAKAEVSSVEVLKDNSGLQAEVRLDGSFESLYKFLTLLESAPYELDIVALDMQKSGEVMTEDGKTKTGGWAAIFKVKLLSFIK